MLERNPEEGPEQDGVYTVMSDEACNRQNVHLIGQSFYLLSVQHV